MLDITPSANQPALYRNSDLNLDQPYKLAEIASCSYNLALLQAKGYDSLRDRLATDNPAATTKVILNGSRGIVVATIV